jgi:hypothetical protein
MRSQEGLQAAGAYRSHQYSGLVFNSRMAGQAALPMIKRE